MNSGPSSSFEETSEKFVNRRYYETLYLSETLSPLSGFTADLFRLPNLSTSGELVRPLLRSLPQIEYRHRKIILPFLSSSKGTEDLSEVEKNVAKFALELRLGSRQALDEGIIPTPKKISDELEKRETLMQIILLLTYITHTPDPHAVQSKKRKRSKHSSRADPDNDSPTSVNPSEDPKTALELLMDRLSVWQAVSELGLNLPTSDEINKVNGKAKSKMDENGIANMLGRFWKSVMLPYFLPKQPDLCSLFHQKVFGHPLPPKLLPDPTTTTKKPRKPKLTRPLPNSKDSLIPPPPSMRYERPRSVSNEGRSLSRVSSRAGSRAPSENGSFRDSPRESNLGMKRNSSRTSTGNESLQTLGMGMGMRRSRSRSQSIDPHPIVGRSDSLSRSLSTGIAAASSMNNKKTGLVRNQSTNRDLFKGREVGLIRRSMSSRKLDREESQSQRFGLLGRKTSSGIQSQAQRRNSTDESQTQPNTLILATPSKPRPFFKPSRSQSQSQYWIPPTPIQEEQPTPRPSYIAETPLAPSRIAHRDTLPLGGMPDEKDEDSDDPLGELWELTDEEEEDDFGQRKGRGMEIVPETPMK
ncbi:hypothetical protein L486_04492 [Kwoniella mangroviensis CBS 10435]|uniref:DNA replication regulator Sld3 C-terminal domain-containing protein n=1 Tax=Kwoniella mangroviensis CBS 10435 TaxID=1331196 RepID=A0A1B9ISF8_9TREE|nr:hypothetical protein L486_04492 [Kwoniella mangroviensis CBS 10435]